MLLMHFGTRWVTRDSELIQALYNFTFFKGSSIKDVCKEGMRFGQMRTEEGIKDLADVRFSLFQYVLHTLSRGDA